MSSAIARDKFGPCDLARIIRSIRGGTCNTNYLRRVTICRRLTAVTTGDGDRRDELSSWKKTRYRSRIEADGRPFVDLMRSLTKHSRYTGRRQKPGGTVTCPRFTVHKAARWFIDDGSSGRWASSDYSSSYTRLVGFIPRIAPVERLIRSQAHDCGPAWAIINSHGIIARVFVRPLRRRRKGPLWSVERASLVGGRDRRDIVVVVELNHELRELSINGKYGRKVFCTIALSWRVTELVPNYFVRTAINACWEHRSSKCFKYSWFIALMI